MVVYIVSTVLYNAPNYAWSTDWAWFTEVNVTDPPTTTGFKIESIWDYIVVSFLCRVVKLIKSVEIFASFTDFT